MNEALGLLEEPRTGKLLLDSSAFFSPALTPQGLSHMVTNYAVMHSAECALNKVSFSY